MDSTDNALVTTQATELPTNPARPMIRVSMAMAAFSLLPICLPRQPLGVPTVASAIGPPRSARSRCGLPWEDTKGGRSAADMRQHRTTLTLHCFKLKAQTLCDLTASRKSASYSEPVLGTISADMGLPFQCQSCWQKQNSNLESRSRIITAPDRFCTYFAEDGARTSSLNSGLC